MNNRLFAKWISSRVERSRSAGATAPHHATISSAVHGSSTTIELHGFSPDGAREVEAILARAAATAEAYLARQDERKDGAK